MAKDWVEQLAADFDEDDLRTGQGRGNQNFKYATAQAVQDRFDEVLPGRWESNVEAVEGDKRGAVKCTITVWPPDQNQAPLRRSDFGYPNGEYDEEGRTVKDDGEIKNDRHETLKEASTDAFRRTASLWGVGRYLYRAGRSSGSGASGNSPRASGGSGGGSTAGSSSHAVGEVWYNPEGEMQIQCADHGRSFAMAWGGRDGKPRMIKCKRKSDDGGYCQFMVPDGGSSPATLNDQQEARQQPREISVADQMEVLRGLREKNGWTLDELAEVLGEPATSGSIRKWIAEGGSMQGLSNKTLIVHQKKEMATVSEPDVPDDLPFE